MVSKSVLPRFRRPFVEGKQLNRYLPIGNYRFRVPFKSNRGLLGHVAAARGGRGG